MYEDHVPTLPDDNRQALFALNELIIVTRTLSESLKATARRLHGEESLSVPARAILLELRKSGPLTAPELARRREVSRQAVQVTVNPLLAEGILETQTNPAHQRSKLVALSARGTELIRQVMRREGTLMSELAGELAAEDMRRAAATLTQLQQLLTKRGD